MEPPGRLVVIRRTGTDGSHYPLCQDSCLFGRYENQSLFLAFKVAVLFLEFSSQQKADTPFVSSGGTFGAGDAGTSDGEGKSRSGSSGAQLMGTDGQGIECDIRIQLPVVSQQHCRIDVQQSEALLLNFSSTNPTKLNGVPVTEPVKLRHGDIITIIDRSFRAGSAPTELSCPSAFPDGKKKSDYSSEEAQDEPRLPGHRLVSPRRPRSGHVSCQCIYRFLIAFPIFPFIISGEKNEESFKRRRVSFGGRLRPELFDENLPPNTPLKKGEIPGKRKSLGTPAPTVLKKVTQQPATRVGRRSHKGSSRRKSVDKNTLQIIYPKRRSSTSRARLPGGKSWAEIVKMGTKKTQIKNVKQDPQRHLSKRQRRNATPQKPVDHVENPFSTGHANSPFSTGHANSPRTIVIGRAHVDRVSVPARPYRMLNNFILNQKVNFPEDFSGLAEMFTTPGKEKLQRTSLCPDATKSSEAEFEDAELGKMPETSDGLDKVLPTRKKEEIEDVSQNCSEEKPELSTMMAAVKMGLRAPSPSSELEDNVPGGVDLCELNDSMPTPRPPEESVMQEDVSQTTRATPRRLHKLTPSPQMSSRPCQLPKAGPEFVHTPEESDKEVAREIPEPIKPTGTSQKSPFKIKPEIVEAVSLNISQTPPAVVNPEYQAVDTKLETASGETQEPLTDRRMRQRRSLNMPAPVEEPTGTKTRGRARKRSYEWEENLTGLKWLMKTPGGHPEGEGDPGILSAEQESHPPEKTECPMADPVPQLPCDVAPTTCDEASEPVTEMKTAHGRPEGKQALRSSRRKAAEGEVTEDALRSRGQSESAAEVLEAARLASSVKDERPEGSEQGETPPAQEEKAALRGRKRVCTVELLPGSTHLSSVKAEQHGASSSPAASKAISKEEKARPESLDAVSTQRPVPRALRSRRGPGPGRPPSPLRTPEANPGETGRTRRKGPREELEKQGQEGSVKMRQRRGKEPQHSPSLPAICEEDTTDQDVDEERKLPSHPGPAQEGRRPRLRHGTGVHADPEDHMNGAAASESKHTEETPTQRPVETCHQQTLAMAEAVPHQRPRRRARGPDIPSTKPEANPESGAGLVPVTTTRTQRTNPEPSTEMACL
ncbi:PREDICTED: antigen KI-67 [Elephantulus edwardii]|uniref:antigen KI-67 n=1 Tax=Elephantulus edwardii TaxID=28737 RepID=UPI0003F08246|nr:PREDICTED: antigen KI-67 [Elephantulus edwardii]